MGRKSRFECVDPVVRGENRGVEEYAPPLEPKAPPLKLKVLLLRGEAVPRVVAMVMGLPVVAMMTGLPDGNEAVRERGALLVLVAGFARTGKGGQTRGCLAEVGGVARAHDLRVVVLGVPKALQRRRQRTQRRQFLWGKRFERHRVVADWSEK